MKHPACVSIFVLILMLIAGLAGAGAQPDAASTPATADARSMAPDLTTAHQALDRAVDRLHWKKPFGSGKDRLFERYRKLTQA